MGCDGSKSQSHFDQFFDHTIRADRLKSAPINGREGKKVLNRRGSEHINADSPWSRRALKILVSSVRFTPCPPVKSRVLSSFMSNFGTLTAMFDSHQP